jgi:hypothetical protein
VPKITNYAGGLTNVSSFYNMKQNSSCLHNLIACGFLAKAKLNSTLKKGGQQLLSYPAVTRCNVPQMFVHCAIVILRFKCTEQH